MAEAGADILIPHMGLTTKGTIGAHTALSLEQAAGRVQAMHDAAKRVNPDILVLCHGGPIAEPVDATPVPGHLSGFRTLFTSFHHFAPPHATRILQDAVEHRRGIGIFEITERMPASFLLAFANILLVLLMAPFTRPFRWTRLFWTYLPPVAPLFVWWDGFASIFRSYTVDELRAMVDALPPNDYVWHIGREPTQPLRITYLIGYPKPR